mgnify:CR=1 FL=1
MAKKVLPLGMNARNFLYILPYNKKGPKRRADNKLRTKTTLIKNNINTPELLATFTSNDSVRNFTWTDLPKSFVVKPSRGYGGSGILLVKKWDGERGFVESDREFSVDDLESHILDILSGVFSLGSLSDSAIIERKIIPMKFFKKIPILGIPDLRIIVFSGVPVMAMMRIPTLQSEGKANLTKGAVGVGIDISTGVTTTAWQKGKSIRLFPDTRIKLRGIRVPEWDEILVQAVKAQQASKLGFAGIDIVLDKNKGPMVLEVNARPGLSIQTVNRASLLERLKRVENITPKPNLERGIEIGKTLFTEDFSEKVSARKKQSNILHVFEKVTVYSENLKKEVQLDAKIDTGAYRTSIDKSLVKDLGLDRHERVVKVRSASGEGERQTVNLNFSLKGRRIQTVASIAKREHLRYPMIIGRKDLKGFLVKPHKETKT